MTSQMSDLEFVQNPGEWPRWPTLSMMPRNPYPSEGSNLPTEPGILVNEGKPKVYEKNELDLVSGNLFGQLNDCKVFEYKSWEDLLKEWRID